MVALAGVSQFLCKLRRSHLNTAHALNALQDDSTHTATRQLSNPRLYIVERQETHMVVVVDGSHNLRVVGHFYCQ